MTWCSSASLGGVLGARSGFGELYCCFVVLSEPTSIEIAWAWWWLVSCSLQGVSW